MKNKIILIIAICFTLSSCFHIQQVGSKSKEKVEEVKIEYSAVSVAEEGGIKFELVTDESDHILTPKIVYKGNGLMFSTGKFFDIHDGKIAYIGIKNGNKNIFLKNILKGKATQQRTFKEDIQSVDISPDGKSIVFDEYAKIGNDKNIYMMNFEQGAALRQIVTSKDWETDPVFSPDNKKIFYSKSDNGKFYVWSMDLATSAITQYGRGASPVFGKDPNLVYVTRLNKANGNSEIVQLNIETGVEIVLVSSSITGYAHPCISPDGKFIAVTGVTKKANSVEPNLNLFVISIDGTGITQLTFHPGHDLNPTWSEDGKSLFFISQRGSQEGKYNIWKMDYKR